MRRLVGLVLGLFNIRPDRNQRWILLSYFTSCSLLAFISPVMCQSLYDALPTRWFAFSSLMGSLSGLAAGMIWRGGFRRVCVRWFMVFGICECVIGGVLGIYMSLFNQNLWIYAIVSLVYGSLVGIVVSKCVMCFRTKMWNDKEREIYDNNYANVVYLSTILGYICGIVWVPSLELALFLFGVTCFVDDAGWLVVYWRNREKLNEV